jgi:peptidoglycan/LPS O-acetylase OafA/YrhL
MPIKLPPPRRDERMTSEQIKARLIFVVACALSFTFVVATMSLIYGLLFVTQPLDVSDNDKSAWATLQPLLLFLTGSLAGLLERQRFKRQTERQTR